MICIRTALLVDTDSGCMMMHPLSVSIYFNPNLELCLHDTFRLVDKELLATTEHVTHLGEQLV